MQYCDTIASRCRYGDVAARLFGEADIIWEHSEDDYQGFANIMAAMPDGRIAHYEWTYGSCSGCDEWENRGLDDDQVEAEMRKHVAFLPDFAAAKRYFRLEGEYAKAEIPTANTLTNGSVPGMLRFLAGGIGDDFRDAGQAFLAWLDRREANTQAHNSDDYVTEHLRHAERRHLPATSASALTETAPELPALQAQLAALECDQARDRARLALLDAEDALDRHDHQRAIELALKAVAVLRGRPQC